MPLLLAMLVATPVSVLRVLECHFLSEHCGGAELRTVALAADISGGHLLMLLIRPSAGSSGTRTV